MNSSRCIRAGAAARRWSIDLPRAVPSAHGEWVILNVLVRAVSVLCMLWGDAPLTTTTEARVTGAYFPVAEGGAERPKCLSFAKMSLPGAG